MSSGDRAARARFGGRVLIVFTGLTLLGLVSASRVLLVYNNVGHGVAWTDALATGLLDAYTWAPFLPWAWVLGARVPLGRRSWLLPLGVHAGASLLAAALHIVSFASVSELVRGRSLERATLELAITSGFLIKFHADVLLYWAVVLSSQVYAARKRARYQELAQSRLETELAAARLDALESHLKPHFLFNALNGVSALVPREPDAAERMLAHLGDLLRRALQSRQQHEWVLSEELAFLRDYVALQRMRFGERLEVTVDAPAALADARVPRFFVQPLVENAIRHGVDSGRGHGRVEVRVRRCGTRLQLWVCDDGPGLDASAADGFGIAGARARLELLYPGEHELAMRTRPTGGTEVFAQWPVGSTSTQPLAASPSVPCPSVLS